MSFLECFVGVIEDECLLKEEVSEIGLSPEERETDGGLMTFSWKKERGRSRMVSTGICCVVVVVLS